MWGVGGEERIGVKYRLRRNNLKINYLCMNRAFTIMCQRVVEKEIKGLKEQQVLNVRTCWCTIGGIGGFV